MDFALTDEQVALRDSASRFGRDMLRRDTEAIDRAEFPREQWDHCAKFGLQGLLVPTQYGGMGRDCVTATIVLEALGHSCSDDGLVHAICTQIICGIQLALFGTPLQQEQHLFSLSEGKIVASQAMTEPDAGSDTSAIRTRAEKRGDAYILNGRKTLISNGPIADLALVFAVTDPDARTLGRASCFLVSASASGFSRGPAMLKMGLNSLQNGDLVFTDCVVPSDALLGMEGSGTTMFAEAMEWERILFGAALIGKLRRVLETTITYVKARRQFGRPIGSFQAIAHRIADIRASLELGRLILQKAAWLKDQGSRATLESSIAKLFVSESCIRACLESVHTFGGYGYMKEFGVERELRDSIASTIYSGTSEIQRNIIAALSDL